MKKLDLVQGSPEWEQYRRSHVGASDIPIIMGKSPFKTASKLWEEQMRGKKGWVSKSMQDGHDLEPLARSWISKVHSCNYIPSCWMHENEWLMASLDGYDEETGNIIEIKHPNDKTCEELVSGCVPPYMYLQIQAQMSVMEKGLAYLVFPNPGYKVGLENGTNPTYNIMVIYRSNEVIHDLLRDGKAFYNSKLDFAPPEPLESDFIEREDEEWNEAANSWKKAKDALKEAEELEEICRDGLKYLAGEDSIKGAGVVVSKSLFKGMVDYSKIPELKGVNLDLYRRPPSERWRISER